jgi:tryptophan-rich sensory protein
MPHLLPAEFIVAIIYGILHILIGVAALLQQWHLRRTNGKTNNILRTSQLIENADSSRNP